MSDIIKWVIIAAIVAGLVMTWRCDRVNLKEEIAKVELALATATAQSDKLEEEVNALLETSKLSLEEANTAKEESKKLKDNIAKQKTHIKKLSEIKPDVAKESPKLMAELVKAHSVISKLEQLVETKDKEIMSLRADGAALRAIIDRVTEDRNIWKTSSLDLVEKYKTDMKKQRRATTAKTIILVALAGVALVL